MNIARRRFLHLVAGAVVLPAVMAHRSRRDLSEAAGAIGRRLCPARRPTSTRVCGSMAGGAARPTLHHRQSGGCRRQSRDRVRRARAGGRLHAALRVDVVAINETLY